MAKRSEKKKVGKWGFYNSHHNKRGRSRATILVSSRLALGTDPDSGRHSDLYAGLAGGIYMG